METKKLQDLSFEALCSIIAKVIHNANKAYVDAIGGRALNPSWEEAREEQRQGLVKAVGGTIINPQTPEFSHEQWCLAREAEGWTKDLKYDFNRKTHPNLVPFDELTFEEQFKSHLYMGIASIFCGGLGILEMPEVTAARTILASKWAAESEDNKLAAEEEIDPVDTEETIALKEKLEKAQAELDRVEAEQNAKDEEKEAIANGERDGELAAVKTAAAAAGTGPDGKPIKEEGPELPLPHPDEILDHKPKDYTAKDLAKDVLGADKVGIENGVGSGEVSEPKPNLPADEVKETTAKEEAEEAVGEDNVGEVPEGQGPTPNLPGKTVGPKKTTKKKTADQGSDK
jgi:hypothetical protein